MPTSTHCIHPINVAIMSDVHYLQKKMQTQCMECGIKRDVLPFTCDYSYSRITNVPNKLDTIVVESYALLCSLTCKENYSKSFRYNPEECITTCAYVKSKMNGVPLNPKRRSPPTWAHERFGGGCKDSDFIDPNFHWPHLDAQNPYLYRPWDPKDPIWQKDFTDTGMACRGCKQNLNGKACTIPIRYSDTTKQITHTIGLFHRNGRCALRFKLSNHNMFTWLDTFWAHQLLTSEPFCLDVDTLVASSDPMMLDAFGGPFTLERLLNGPLNEMYCVNFLGISGFPFYKCGALDDSTGLEKIVVENATKSPLELGPKYDQPLIPMEPDGKGIWLCKFALLVVESMQNVLSPPHAKRLKEKGYILLPDTIQISKK